LNVDILPAILTTSLSILNDASVWLVLSFALAGLIHHFVRPDRMQRMLGNRKLSSLVRGTVSGMLLPICSCGVIPLGVGLYYSGACLGPTLAFMAATPIINPAAVLLAYGLLGPRIATIYFISGFVVPMLVGVLGNTLAGSELRAPGVERVSPDPGLEAVESAGVLQRLLSGLHWGFMELGVMVSRYIVFGVLLAGAIISMIPKSVIQQYLGDPGMISVGGVSLLGSVMYVCAVGHIPFIAALVASGAAPGVAIAFLMTGAATNLPELASIFRVIGPRAVLIYVVTMVSSSMLIGYLTNVLILKDFMPFFHHGQGSGMTGLARSLIFAAPKPVEYLCSGLILSLCLYPLLLRTRRYLLRMEAPQ